MTRPGLFAVGLSLLLAAWGAPLAVSGAPPFSTHMALHMIVVAVAAPLLALGVAGGRFDPASRAPRAFSALPISLLELLAVWTWHTPALHCAARHQVGPWLLEQGTFLIAGCALWLAVLGGGPARRRARSAEGVTALLLTSMHMTLLGALIALTPRVLYPHALPSGALSALADQQLGGAIMLLVGGVAYLAGGVGLMAEVLRARSLRAEGGRA